MAIYLDHAASSPLSDAAATAMISWLTAGYGNPSGSHRVARRARAVVDDARDQVAALVGARPSEVVFTSGGTEADNLAVLGPLAARSGAVVTTAVEHPAVTEAAAASGREVRVVGVDGKGVVDLDRLREALVGDVAVVSVQLVNQETGVVQPLTQLARRVRKWAPGALLHTDAVQAAAWLDLPALAADADLVSVSGHKIGGPQGSGALVARGDVELSPVIHGGGQEQERRSGTHNVAAIVGFGAAADALRERLDQGTDALRVGGLRDRLARLLTEKVPGLVVTAEDSDRSPGHCHVCIPGVESEALLFLLDEAGVCASAGSACASGAVNVSPVLLAMGMDKYEAGGSLRLTLGPTTTEAEIDEAAGIVAVAAARLGRS